MWWRKKIIYLDNLTSRIKTRKISLQTIEQKADEIIALFQKYGSDAYYGEPVTQLQHACQAATWAHTEGYADDIQLAAFLHDIAHLIADVEPMADLGVMNHEQVGAD